ncbi:hypothetical protein B0H14DRAFT_3137817 [Mycena olivaceomarginata]|nr:hypothetical protein B0H14DRAFT_3137817 [Mycena olivaceomarginata]
MSPYVEISQHARSPPTCISSGLRRVRVRALPRASPRCRTTRTRTQTRTAEDERGGEFNALLAAGTRAPVQVGRSTTAIGTRIIADAKESRLTLQDTQTPVLVFLLSASPVAVPHHALGQAGQATPIYSERERVRYPRAGAHEQVPSAQHRPFRSRCGFAGAARLYRDDDVWRIGYGHGHHTLLVLWSDAGTGGGAAYSALLTLLPPTFIPAYEFSSSDSAARPEPRSYRFDRQCSFRDYRSHRYRSIRFSPPSSLGTHVVLSQPSRPPPPHHPRRSRRPLPRLSRRPPHSYDLSRRSALPPCPRAHHSPFDRRIRSSPLPASAPSSNPTNIARPHACDSRGHSYAVASLHSTHYHPHLPSSDSLRGASPAWLFHLPQPPRRPPIPQSCLLRVDVERQGEEGGRDRLEGRWGAGIGRGIRRRGRGRYEMGWHRAGGGAPVSMSSAGTRACAVLSRSDSGVNADGDGNAEIGLRLLDASRARILNPPMRPCSFIPARRRFPCPRGEHIDGAAQPFAIARPAFTASPLSTVIFTPPPHLMHEAHDHLRPIRTPAPPTLSAPHPHWTHVAHHDYGARRASRRDMDSRSVLWGVLLARRTASDPPTAMSLYVPRPLITANPPASGITCHLCQSFIFISSSMPALDGISTLPILYETFSRCSSPPRFPLRVVDVNFRRVLRCLGQGVDCRVSGRKHALSMPSYRAPTFFDMTLTCARGGAPFLIWKEDNEIARRQTSSSDRGIPCGWAHDARERGVFAQAWDKPEWVDLKRRITERPCTSFVIADEPQRGPALTTTGWEWRASRGEEHEASVVRKIEVAPAKNKGTLTRTFHALSPKLLMREGCVEAKDREGQGRWGAGARGTSRRRRIYLKAIPSKEACVLGHMRAVNGNRAKVDERKIGR